MKLDAAPPSFGQEVLRVEPPRGLVPDAGTRSGGPRRCKSPDQRVRTRRMMNTFSSGSAVTFLLWTLRLGAIVLLPACDMNKIVADGTAALLKQATPAVDGLWDYELAGVGTQSAIMQLEAFHEVSPDNEDLSLQLAKAYVGFANGWVESDYEIAYAADDADKADRLRQRARLFYLRAYQLALRCMRNRHSGIEQALHSNREGTLAKYLDEHYRYAASAPPVFWAGLSLAAAINLSLDQPDLVAELGTAKALVEHAKQLDEMFFHGGAFLVLGTIEAALPPALGGNPEKGRAMFEEGLRKTDRKNHMIHVSYARTYAVSTQNRELFIKLLSEVIDAPDMGRSVRLNNKVARRRAERYLAQANQLF